VSEKGGHALRTKKYIFYEFLNYVIRKFKNKPIQFLRENKENKRTCKKMVKSVEVHQYFWPFLYMTRNKKRPLFLLLLLDLTYPTAVSQHNHNGYLL
jgi:hypothetical protein